MAVVLFRTFLVSISLAGLVGCVPTSIGRNFARPDTAALGLGSTTKEIVLERYGNPFGTDVSTQNGEQVEHLTYVYSATLVEPVRSGVSGARTMVFCFWKNRMVGHLFASSMQFDATYFETEKAKQVTAGMTEQQVKEILGEPNGRFIYPFVPREDEEKIKYFYTELHGLIIHSRTLEVVLSKDRVVTGVALSTTGGS